MIFSKNFNEKNILTFIIFLDIYDLYNFLGHYSDVFALDEMFGKKFILIDGELFKTKPWVALGQIEKSLGMKNYFTQDRFGQRKVDLRFRPLNLLNKFIISIS